MRKMMIRMMAVSLIMIFTGVPVVADDVPFSGFLGSPDVYNQLKPGPEGGAKFRWLKPGVDFAKYSKLMVDSVIFFLCQRQ
ncbi:MAG: DUF3313 family protein [Desulfatirhabdiaceae bacterium]